MIQSTTYRLIPFLFVLAACLSTVLTGCRKVPKFSETPNIQFKDINKKTFYNADQSPVGDSLFADSVIIGIHFEDGDGDLGFPDDQRSEDNVDYFVDVYRKTNGIYNLATFDLPFNGHLPLLAPVGTPGPIEGDVFYAMIFNYSDDQAADDTLKFAVKLKDRKGNYSNTVESDPVIIRKTP
ncbi:MAG: hypothetical protein JWM14_1113 [Chitinophagaceae bacterium]|nr:hypothetical protein [Chitinophagaceae bacterium]